VRGGDHGVAVRVEAGGEVGVPGGEGAPVRGAPLVVLDHLEHLLGLRGGEGPAGDLLTQPRPRVISFASESATT